MVAGFQADPVSRFPVRGRCFSDFKFFRHRIGLLTSGHQRSVGPERDELLQPFHKTSPVGSRQIVLRATELSCRVSARQFPVHVLLNHFQFLTQFPNLSVEGIKQFPAVNLSQLASQLNDLANSFPKPALPVTPVIGRLRYDKMNILIKLLLWVTVSQKQMLMELMLVDQFFMSDLAQLASLYRQ